MLTSSNVYYYEAVDGLTDVLFLDKHKIYLIKEQQYAPSYLVDSTCTIIVDKLLWDSLIKEAVSQEEDFIPDEEYLLYIEKCRVNPDDKVFFRKLYREAKENGFKLKVCVDKKRNYYYHLDSDRIDPKTGYALGANGPHLESILAFMNSNSIV